MSEHEHHGHGHDHVHLDESHWAAWADHAELEGEVLLRFVTGAAAMIAEHVGSVRRILDIGSGPGVGTAELARCFPGAEVVAVDASPAMLERVGARAARLGVADRVGTHAAELPGGLAGLAPADVVWASMSLHHVGDEVAALRAMGAALAPGGLLALVEFADDPVRVLPDELDVGEPGLGERLERANRTWFGRMRAGLPGHEPSADLAAMVAAAGLEVLRDDVVVVRHDAPVVGDARRFAVEQLRRARDQLAALLDEPDVAALDVLTDPDDPRGIEHRDDVEVVASRRVVLARRRSARA
jgi:SAM-dependent methyltransferase